MSNALTVYIERLNAETQAWVKEVEGRWSTTLVADLAHWAEQGVYTVEQLKHNRAAADHYDYYKDVNGIRPRWMDYSEMSLEEIENAITNLVNQQEEDHGHEAWLEEVAEENHKYNDLMYSDPEPTKYELIAEAAGY